MSLAELKTQYDNEAAAIEDDYQRSLSSEGSRTAQSIAEKKRQRSLAALQSRYKPQFVSYEAKRNEAVLEAAQISEHLKIVMANLPQE